MNHTTIVLIAWLVSGSTAWAPRPGKTFDLSSPVKATAAHGRAIEKWLARRRR